MPKDFYKSYEIPNEAATNILTLDVDGGYELDQSTREVVLGKTYTLPKPIRHNYAFVGWYEKENGEGKKYTDYNGNSYEKWAENGDRTLYAHWTSTVSTISEITEMQLSSQQIYSAKSSAFGLGLDISKLKEAGYTRVEITIYGACREYDHRMNDRGRYFALSDAATGGVIAVMTFKVQGFSHAETALVSLNDLNTNGQYVLQLISDNSPNYDEKLIVGSMSIVIKAVN